MKTHHLRQRRYHSEKENLHWGRAAVPRFCLYTNTHICSKPSALLLHLWPPALRTTWCLTHRHACQIASGLLSYACLQQRFFEKLITKGNHKKTMYTRKLPTQQLNDCQFDTWCSEALMGDKHLHLPLTFKNSDKWIVQVALQGGTASPQELLIQEMNSKVDLSALESAGVRIVKAKTVATFHRKRGLLTSSSNGSMLLWMPSFCNSATMPSVPSLLAFGLSKTVKRLSDRSGSGSTST